MKIAIIVLAVITAIFFLIYYGCRNYVLNTPDEKVKAYWGYSKVLLVGSLFKITGYVTGIITFVLLAIMLL